MSKLPKPVEDITARDQITNPALMIGEEVTKNTPEEASSYLDLLYSIGVENDTTAFIEEKKKEYKEQNTKVLTRSQHFKALQAIVDMFPMFKIVPFKTIYRLSEDYDLMISGIRNYGRAIPEDNLEDINSFVNEVNSYLNEPKGYTGGHIMRNIKIIPNSKFCVDLGKAVTVEESSISFMLHIAAPKSHFKPDLKYDTVDKLMTVSTRPKLDIKGISWNVGLKALAETIEAHKDPIVFMNFVIHETIYSLVVTAWDKEGDDSRLRSLFV